MICTPLATVCGEVQAAPAGRSTANTELWLAVGPPTVQATAASPFAFITKIGPDAPGIRSCAAFHFESGGRSAVQTPSESAHTAVAKPAELIRIAGKTEVVWSPSGPGET